MARTAEDENTRTAPSSTNDLLGFVALAVRALGSLPTVGAVLRRAAALSVPSLADISVIFTAPRDGELSVELVHREPAEQGEARDLLFANSSALLAASRLYPQRPRWIRNVYPAGLKRLYGTDPAVAALVADLDIGALVVQPLSLRGRTWGVLALARLGEHATYTAGEFAASSVLARRIALALAEAASRSGAENSDLRQRRGEEAAGKWAHAFESAIWGAAILDPVDWRIESANPAFARLHGYDSPDELIGRAFSDFQGEGAERALRDRITGRDETSATIETTHLRQDGSTFPVLETIATMRGSRGGIDYRTAQVQDLTELRRAEERLRGAQRMETVGRLAGGVAHEINNMMTVVLGFADFLTRDPALAPALRHDVSEIQHAAERARGITRELLAFSRKQILQPQVLDAGSVVRESEAFLRSVLPASIALDVRAEPDAWVNVDQTQLEQILLNLTLNAKDAMPAGGRVRIGTSIRDLTPEALQRRTGVLIPRGAYVVLTVHDTGHGMDASTAAHIFEPFFTTKDVGDGTGLGLASVYGIVKQSGGYITLDTKPARGTRFRVFLPLMEAPQPAEPEPSVSAPHGDETLLVVEDDDVVRRLTVRILRTHGFTTLEAADGAAACALLAEPGRQVDLVLTDLVMPVLDGNGLRRRMRELGLDIPVLFMSAYSGDEATRMGMLESGAPFIQKPFAPAELAGEVRRVLDLKLRA